MKKTVYEIVTERLIKKLQEGTAPWAKPWTNKKYGNVFEPQNIVSKTTYKGINRLLTWSSGFSCPYWATYKQISGLGGTVRKGEKGTPIVFWSPLFLDKNGKRVDEKFAVKKTFFLKYFTVFNLEQADGVDIPAAAEAPAEADEFDPIDAAEGVLENWETKCPISHRGSRAFYRPSDDTITLPEKTDFKSPEKYYSTAFHEAIHATGHESRLNRKTLTGTAKFGDDTYSKEELVAEFGAAFLCATVGIENKTINNSAAYLKSWIAEFKDKPKLAVESAGLAQKAADHILNR
tara:strand:- start:53 stop:925 length:873 start_codon:yes stop_codon:yes gene_type:complete